jgi:hypothetical protein
MKKLLFFVLALVLILTISCSKSAMPTASDNSTTVSALATGWHQMTQAQRNLTIISAAISWTSGTLYTGQGECKGWVKTIVLNASGGLVSLPATLSNNYQWATSGSGTPQYILYPNSCVPIQNAQAGCIVQMCYKNNDGSVSPHTMIIIAMHASSMDIIDCNFHGDDRIRYANMLFTTFNNAACGLYSLYYIL